MKRNWYEEKEQAMEVQKQANKWQGKGNKQRIRNCILALLQSANLGKESQKRKKERGQEKEKHKKKREETETEM